MASRSGLEQGAGDARHARESGQRNHVQLVVVLVMGDGAVPDFAGAGEAGNEDHGAAVAGDLDLEWLLGRQSGAECEGDQECFHSSDCVPGVAEDGVKCDERFLGGAGGLRRGIGTRRSRYRDGLSGGDRRGLMEWCSHSIWFLPRRCPRSLRRHCGPHHPRPWALVRR